MVTIDTLLPEAHETKKIWGNILISAAKNFIFYGPGFGAVCLLGIVNLPAFIYAIMLLFFFGILFPAGRFIMGYLKADSGASNTGHPAKTNASWSGDTRSVTAGIQSKNDVNATAFTVESNTNQGSTAVPLSAQEILYIKNEKLMAPFWGIINRMNAEIQNLAKRGNVNLLIGGAVALLGISVLILALFSSDDKNVDIIKTFLPKLSFVVFVEFIAFFFLSLYRQCINEIKYYQNEITNIESKTAALQIALVNDDRITIKNIIAQLSLTERNFILAKGQSTVDLERERLTGAGQEKLIELLRDLIKAGPFK